jgi:hypothetical protein
VEYQWCAILAMTVSAYHFGHSMLDYAFYWMDKANRGSFPSDRPNFWLHIKTPPMMSTFVSLFKRFCMYEMAGICFVLNILLYTILLTSWFGQWIILIGFSVLCIQVGLVMSTFDSWSSDSVTTTNDSDFTTFIMICTICTPTILLYLHKATLFVIVDIPLVAWESVVPNSLESLHIDINNILSSPEWSPDEDDPNEATKLTTIQPPPPPPQRYHPWTARCKIGLSKWWHLLLCLCCIPNMQAQAIPLVECISVSDLPQLCFSDHPSFCAERPNWKERRKWKRQSERIEDSVPNPFTSLNIQQESPPEPPNEKSSELGPRMDSFIKSFDPASAGMRLLLAERIDKIMIRSKMRKKRRVSVDLKQCKQQISVSAGRWLFPAADESVFNSLCDGFDAPLIVDSGASCCISPHREDFITYSDSKVKVKDLSGSNKVAGEGMIKWKVLDKDGLEVELELKAYHMPNASVRLLSPQSMIKSIEGTKGFQDVLKYTLKIPGGIALEAPYGRANLPYCFPSAAKTSLAFGLAVSIWRMIRQMIGPS